MNDPFEALNDKASLSLTQGNRIEKSASVRVVRVVRVSIIRQDCNADDTDHAD